jgi:hypothetical protein
VTLRSNSSALRSSSALGLQSLRRPSNLFINVVAFLLSNFAFFGVPAIGKGALASARVVALAMTFSILIMNFVIVSKAVVVVSRADLGITGVLADLGVRLLVDPEVEDKVAFGLAMVVAVVSPKLAGC